MAQLIVFAVIFLVMYLVLILPQQRRQKETAAMLASLDVGDEVVLASGIHGFITTLDKTVAWIEVSEGVDLKVSRSAIASIIRADVDAAVEDD